MLASALFLRDELINLKILKNGQLVEMRIVDIPYSCVGTKAKWFMKVQYHSKVFSKQIPSGFCEKYKKGDLIRLRYLDTENRVLLSNEGLTSEFVSIAGFALISIFMIGWSLKKSTI